MVDCRFFVQLKLISWIFLSCSPSRAFKTQYDNRDITSNVSMILSIACLHYPWGGISPGTESMGGTFLCHIPSLGGSVWLEDRRLGSRSKGAAEELGNDLSAHGRPVLCANRWSETSDFWNKISSGADDGHGTRDLKSRFNAYQQCINSDGSSSSESLKWGTALVPHCQGQATSNSVLKTRGNCNNCESSLYIWFPLCTTRT